MLLPAVFFRREFGEGVDPLVEGQVLKRIDVVAVDDPDFAVGPLGHRREGRLDEAEAAGTRQEPERERGREVS